VNGENPFEAKPDNNSERTVSQHASFVDIPPSLKIDTKNMVVSKDPFLKQKPPERLNDSLQFSTRRSGGEGREKSFQGFEFDDFMNVSAKRSNSGSSQPKKA
jgi:hypothetical protein